VVLPSLGADATEVVVKTVLSGVHSFSVPYEKNYEWPPKSEGWP
jgi:alpha-L-rhamnosidase